MGDTSRVQAAAAVAAGEAPLRARRLILQFCGARDREEEEEADAAGDYVNDSTGSARSGSPLVGGCCDPLSTTCFFQ